MRISDAFYERAEEWTKEKWDDRVGEALNRIDKWSERINADEESIIVDLVNRFNYFTKSKIREIIIELSKRAEKDFFVSDINSVICPIKKIDGKWNSSYSFWSLHREVSGLNSNIYMSDVLEIGDSDWCNIDTLVYIDDCSGTGTQFTKYLKRTEKSFEDRKQAKTFKGKHIVLIVIYAMEEALTTIQKYAERNGLLIDVVCYCLEEKAFDGKPKGDKNIFLALSGRRGIVEHLGFQEAEALVAFPDNTPNDTIGLFWTETEENIAPFPRRNDPEPGWKKSKEKKKERALQLYGAKS